MAQAQKFTVKWQAEDGYCGGSRPQSFTISANEIESEMSERELRDLFEEDLQFAFNERVSAATDDEDAFVAWAKERQAEMRAEDGDA